MQPRKLLKLYFKYRAPDCDQIGAFANFANQLNLALSTNNNIIQFMTDPGVEPHE